MTLQVACSSEHTHANVNVSRMGHLANASFTLARQMLVFILFGSMGSVPGKL